MISIILSPEKRFSTELKHTQEAIKCCDFYHYRKPSLSTEEKIRFLEELTPKEHSKIVVHIYEKKEVEMYHSFPIQGVSLNKKTRELFSQKEIDALSEKYQIVATSCHSIEEIKALKNKYRYIFLSPVFNSISKKGLLGKSFLLSGVCSYVIIALGGVTKEKTGLLKQKGFSGYAILGDYWKEKV